MSDDSIIKLLAKMQMDYSMATESTEKFEGSISKLNQEIAKMKDLAIQSAKDVGSAFTSNMSGKEIKNAFTQMQKENKPIEVKVITDKAEREMMDFARSMGIRLNKEMKGHFSDLADGMFEGFDQSKLDHMVKSISDAYIEAENKYARRTQQSMFQNTDDMKIYEYLRTSTLKLDESTINARKNVDGFNDAIRNLVKTSSDAGLSLDQMGQELSSMGVKGLDINTEDIAERMARAVESVRDFRHGFSQLGSDIPREEVESFVQDSLLKLTTSLAQIKHEAESSKESLSELGKPTKGIQEEIKASSISAKDMAKSIKESTLEQMKAQAASVQQRATTKGLSQEYAQQAGTLREQLSVIQARLQAEGKLTAEEVAQTQQLKEQLDILNAQTRAGISDKNRENPDWLGEEMQRRVSWFATGGVFYGMTNAAKEAKETIKDVEMGMVEIGRVMTDSSFIFDEYRDNLFQLGVDYGQTFENVQNIALRWAQSGYNVADSLELTETSLLALNTAELDAKNATESMIGIMAQWQLQAEEMALVMDKINITADNYSVTSQDLVDGLLRSSGAAKNMNMTLDETIGLLTVMREASGRTGKEVGNALNSILSYITRDKSITTLQSLGIQMFTDETETQFRNAMDIFKDIHASWSSLSKDIQDGFVAAADDAGLFNEELAATLDLEKEWDDVQKRDASQSAAGTHRRNYFIGMIERMANAQEVLNGMMEAEGYSMEENAATMETLEKKQESLKASAEALAVAMGDAGLSGALKALIDSGTGALNTINNMPKPMKDLVLATTSTFIAVKTLELGMKTFGIQLPGISQMIGSLTSGTWSLSAALKAGGAGLATFAKANAPLLALSAAVGTIIAVTNHIKKQREETEKSIEVFQRQKEISDSINELIPQYEELASKSRLNAEEQQKLLDVKSQITDLLPETKSALDNENLSLATQLEIIKELNEEELNRAQSKAREAIEKHESNYDQYVQEVEAAEIALERWTDLYEELFARRDTLSKEEQRDMETARLMIDAQTERLEVNKSNIEAVDSAREILNNTINEGTNSLNEDTGALGDNTDALADNANTIGYTAEEMEKLDKAFQDVTSRIQDYNRFLSELNTTEGLSAQSKQNIIDNYQNLLPYLDEEGALREYLIATIAAEEEAQRIAFLNKVWYDSEFFNHKVLNNANLVNKLQEYYRVDLEGVKDLASAKGRVENALIQELSKAWGNYFRVVNGQIQITGEVVGKYLGTEHFGRIMDDLKRANNALAGFNDIVFSGIGIDLSSINLSKVPTATPSSRPPRSSGSKPSSSKPSSSKSSEQKPAYDFDKDLQMLEDFLVKYINERGKKEKEALENWYKAEKETMDKLHKEKTKALKKELDDFKKMVNEKIRLLEDQHDEEDYAEKLKKEQEKARDIQKQIDRLAFDDSVEARNKKAELRKELADQNERIATMEKDKERDLKIQGLQDSLEIKETEINNVIELEDEKYEKEKQALEEMYQLKIDNWEEAYSNANVYAEANKAITTGLVKDFEGKMVSVKNAYLDFEDRYGKGMGILGDKTKKEFLATIDRVNLGMRGLYKEAGYVGTSVANSMNSGSRAASGLNSRLGSVSGSLGGIANRAKSATSEINRLNNALKNATVNNLKLTQRSVGYNQSPNMYHNIYADGGKIDFTGPAWVDGSPTNPEYVFNYPQFRDLAKYIAYEKSKVTPVPVPMSGIDSNGGYGNSIQIESFLTLYGDITPEAVPMVKKVANDAIGELKNALKKLGV